jgi:hypothetical protein
MFPEYLFLPLLLLHLGLSEVFLSQLFVLMYFLINYNFSRGFMCGGFPVMISTRFICIANSLNIILSLNNYHFVSVRNDLFDKYICCPANCLVVFLGYVRIVEHSSSDVVSL